MDESSHERILIYPRLGCPTPQRVTTYALSPNRQRPFAGAAHAAVFNTFRRFRHQVLYVVPPFVAAYAAMNWAIERYASPKLLQHPDVT
jgi:ubiquinol-cytochrome c reductase subunit 8